MTTIVMTGGTRGIGRAALRWLGEHRVLLGARGEGPGGVETLPLDLGRLDSVRRFVQLVEERTEAGGIDALVLNAGLGAPIADRTAEGFHTTFGVNHLAHYVVARQLADRLRPGGRIVLTTSGTHDPARKTPIPPPTHADADRLAHPERDPALDGDPATAMARAYAASKLCNVLTARALARRQPAIQVIAYDPGPTPGTGLGRSWPLSRRIAWAVLGLPGLGRLVPGINRVQDAGRVLAELALGHHRAPDDAPCDGIYALHQRGSLRWVAPSELARRDDAMEALWRDSAAMVGLDA